MECNACNYIDFNETFNYCPKCGDELTIQCSGGSDQELQQTTDSSDADLEMGILGHVGDEHQVSCDSSDSPDFDMDLETSLFLGNKFAEEIHENVYLCVDKEHHGTGDHGSYDHGAMLDIFRNNGFIKGFRMIKERLEACDREKIRLGIIGRSGVGKSSFLSLLLDNENIKSGSGDTTQQVTEYEHPSYKERFTMTDMPGFGTAEMPKRLFLNLVDLSKFDYMFYFIDLVLMEDDLWLFDKLAELGIPFCLVRSKLDIYMASKETANLQKDIAYQNLHKKISKTLLKFDKYKDIKLFLISTRIEHLALGDFTKLIDEISTILPFVKAEALLFFLPTLDRHVIDLKVKALGERSPWFTFLLAVRSFLGASSYQQMKGEINRYIQVLCLDKSFVKPVPGLKHVWFRKGNLPDEKDCCWRRKSYLEESLNELKEDAIQVHRFYKENAS